MTGKTDRKRKKQYYAKGGGSSKRKCLSNLAMGSKGFLLTCNMKEKEAVRDAYRVLNDYADELYGPEKAEEKEAVSEGEDGDFDAALEKEVNAIKDMKHSDRRFDNIHSGVKNCLFIKCNITDRPDTITSAMFNDIYSGKDKKSRFIMRFQPVNATCKANEQSIVNLVRTVIPSVINEKSMEQLLSESDSERVGYKININIRNNSTGLGKSKLLTPINEAIVELDKRFFPSLDNPVFVLAIDVLKTVCCIGILRDFSKFKKYNVQEMKAKDHGKEDLLEPPKKETNDSEGNVTEILHGVEGQGSMLNKDHKQHESSENTVASSTPSIADHGNNALDEDI